MRYARQNEPSFFLKNLNALRCLTKEWNPMSDKGCQLTEKTKEEWFKLLWLYIKQSLRPKMHTSLLCSMWKKYVCQMSRMCKSSVLMKHPDDVIDLLNLYCVQPTDAVLSHNVTGADEPSDSKVKVQKKKSILHLIQYIQYSEWMGILIYCILYRFGNVYTKFILLWVEN